MNSIWTIARKELSDSLRNRWLMAISLVFATLALGIAWFGAAASGQVGYASTPATIASLASLGIFLIPLIALLLAYDAIVGEEEGGTLLLLMTYPLSRSQRLLPSRRVTRALHLKTRGRHRRLLTCLPKF